MTGAGQPLPSAQIDGSQCAALTVFETIRQVVRSSGGELTGLTVACSREVGILGRPAPLSQRRW